MITFARRHKKPVFIAEATPVFQDIETGKYEDADIKKPEIAKDAYLKPGKELFEQLVGKK